MELILLLTMIVALLLLFYCVILRFDLSSAEGESRHWYNTLLGERDALSKSNMEIERLNGEVNELRMDASSAGQLAIERAGTISEHVDKIRKLNETIQEMHDAIDLMHERLAEKDRQIESVELARKITSDEAKKLNAEVAKLVDELATLRAESAKPAAKPKRRGWRKSSED